MTINRARLAARLALVCTIAFALISGWRDIGIDRQNYLAMYEGVLTSEGIYAKLFFAKDFSFLVLSSFASYFSTDPRAAFLIICLLSIVTKYFAIKEMAPKYLFSFLIAYIIFISPGLEFAAMRSGLSIGFLMLALAYNKNRIKFITFSLLAIASHIAMLPVVLLSYRPITNLLAKHKFGYIGIAIFISLAASSLITFFPSGVDYEDNQGTRLAYSLPTATFVIALLIFYPLNRISGVHSDAHLLQFLVTLKYIIYGLIAIAFGISGMVVTAGTRYLEIAWFLLLLPSIVLYNKSYYSFSGLILFICFLVYLNIYRFTWLAIINPHLY